MFNIDRKKIILIVNKYASYAINILIIASILGVIWFFIWGLLIAAR